MNKTIKKQLTSSVLTVAMMASLVPATAYAEDIPQNSLTESIVEASGSLEEVFTSGITQTSPGNYQVTGDNVSLSNTVTIPAGTSITLDLNGKTVNWNGSAAEAVEILGTLTIKDSSNDASGKLTITTNSESTFYAFNNKGTLVLESGTIEVNSTNSSAKSNTLRGVFMAADNARFDLNGGTLSVTNNGGGNTFGVYAKEAERDNPESPDTPKNVTNGQINMNGGTLHVSAQKAADGISSGMVNGMINITAGTINVESESGSSTGISHTVVGDVNRTIALNITGGEIKSNAKTSGLFNSSYGLNIGKNGSTVTITNGTITSTCNNQPDDAVSFDSNVATISGGTFNGLITTSLNKTLTITGGTFSVDPTAFVPGYCAPSQSSDFTWTVTLLTEGEASINGHYYPTLDAAIEAAADSDTVKLEKDLTSDLSTAKNISINKDITFDGNGKTISGNVALYVAADNATTTIQNVNFSSIHNEKSDRSPLYASNLAGKLIVQNCTFTNCDWDAIQTTPVDNAEIVIQNNTFTLSDDATVKQQRFVHVDTLGNATDFSVTVSGNKMIGNTVQEAMGVYYPTDSTKVHLTGNYITKDDPVCILVGTGVNAAELAYPMAKEDMSLDTTTLALTKDVYYSDAFTDFSAALKDAEENAKDLVLVQDIPVNTAITLPEDVTIDYNDKYIILQENGQISSSIDLSEVVQAASGYEVKMTGTAETGFVYTVTAIPDEPVTPPVVNPDPEPTPDPSPSPDPTPEPEQPEDSETTVTNPDGSTTTTITKGDGSSSVTNESVDGKVEAEVTLSQEALDAAEGSVTLPMPEVDATRDLETAPEITVSHPDKDSVKVEVPVNNVTTGTVAVLANEDGSETIIKDTVMTESGIAVSLSDGQTIKVIDNSKTFSDVADNYWGASAIDFATSRELFVGTSDDEFSPEAGMTRAMVWTVLARYEGANATTAPGEAWYEFGREWAMENGISDGTMHDQTITREQLAAMLYRYVGSPEVSGSIGHFSDAESVNSWARDAMIWAVQNGLIVGMGDNTLEPQGTATRTQVAAILQRFIEMRMA